MKQILHMQNSWPFLTKFHVLHYQMSLWLLPKSSGGRIKNDKNSNGDEQQIRNGHSAWDRYHPVTVTVTIL
jgi:hypothetical protein